MEYAGLHYFSSDLPTSYLPIAPATIVSKSVATLKTAVTRFYSALRLSQTMHGDKPTTRVSSDVPSTDSSTSAASSKAATSGSTTGTALSPCSTNPSTSKAGTTASSIASSWRRRRPSFHVTSFTLSLVCKLLTVHHSPPPLRSLPPSSAPSTVSLATSTPVMKPVKVYGDIIGPHLCKVVLVLKELGLPYVLKILDHSTVDRDPYAPTALTRGIPALDDPNTGLTLWEVSE